MNDFIVGFSELNNDSAAGFGDVIKGDKGDKGDTGDTGVGIASTIVNSDYSLTITLTDGTSYTTGSIRGAQGEKGDKGDKGDKGADGGMQATVYDPNAHEQDIFAYADGAVSTHNSSSSAHSSLFDDKVDKVSGKGLSTNDYDNTEKANVASAVSHIANTSNPHSVTAAQVGLGNCNNTSDANKPISTATQTALDAKANKDSDAVSGNVAKFDANHDPIDSGYAASNILGLSYTVVSTWT